MTLPLWPRVVRLIACYVLAGIFLYSGLIKAGASEEFLLALGPFTFLPGWLLEATAFWLPWLEIAAAVLLVIPRTARWGAVLVLGMLAVFITVLGWALSEGIIVACSCFGADETPSAGKMVMAIVRDVVLAGAALLVICIPGPGRIRKAKTG